MPGRFAVLVVSLVLASTASANPLIGVWRADPDLALLEAGKPTTLELEPREILFSPDLLGRLVAIYGDSEVEFRLAERSVRLSYRIVATGSDFVDVEYGDQPSDEPVRVRLLLHEGLLYVPVEELGFHGVFQRIDAPAAPAP